MPYIISIKAEFCAAMSLDMPGPCARLHGHTYTVIAEIKLDNLNSNGIAVDYCQLQQSFEQLVQTIDHCHLNQHPWFKQVAPSSENIAKIIYEKLEAKIKLPINKISVSENSNCKVSYVSE